MVTLVEVHVEMVASIIDAPVNALTSSTTFSLVSTKYTGMSKLLIGWKINVLARSLVLV